MYTNILLPTDGSDLSRKAISHGIALARTLGAKVTALSVVLPSHAPSGAGLMTIGEDVLVEGAEEFLQFVAREAREKGVEAECFYVAGDSPHEEIVAAATQRNCDLICMGAHARSGLAELLLGSQTMSVLKSCEIPVLVLR